ncbi:hypothetical protein OROHE_015689 [Orobanche hederae]
MREFAEFVARGELVDLSLRGRKYTWYRSNGMCKSRIDRALMNEKWLSLWPNSLLRGLKRSTSDHCAIMVEPTAADWGAKPFRFLNDWLSHPEFRSKVEESCREDGVKGWGCFVFKEKLKRLQETLRGWNKEVFGNIDRKMEDLKEEILGLDRRDEERGLEVTEIVRRKEASTQLLLALKNKKSVLQQKARLRWLKESDINSSYYHKMIHKRRNRNGLWGMEVEGGWSEEPRVVKEAVFKHFSVHFKRRSGARMWVPQDFAVRKVSEMEGDGLTRRFSEEEVREAVWDCDLDRSPGPDGFNLGFFKACWDIIKGDLCRVFEEFYVNGRITRGCNSFFIVLIPKKEGATRLSQFRPVSLIGSLYKVIVKVLARRMRPVMESVIGESQSAFIQGRNILDGIIVLNEVVEEAKKRKSKRVIFKIDFAKAYDSIEWEFLLTLMERMNFPGKWRKWVRECISTASANVLVNGSPSVEFQLERGVRQGDPLSPFLFLIATEGLNLLMNRAVDRGIIRPAKVGRDGVCISHLQYADDTIFIIDGAEENARSIRGVLKVFELLSGLAVNYDLLALICRMRKCIGLQISFDVRKD